MFTSSAILCWLKSVFWMRIKAHGLDTQKPIYLQKVEFIQCLIAFLLEELHVLWKWTLNMLYFSMTMKLFHWCYFCTWLVKKNQNLLAANCYKMNTTFVWDQDYSIWSWIVRCFGKMRQLWMNSNSFSSESLWGKKCLQCICEAFTVLCLAWPDLH